MITEGRIVYLEIRDVMRLNLLVRDRINFEAFKRWYDTLHIPEQAALTNVLFHFACQASFDAVTCRQAIADAKLDSTDPTVIHAQEFHEVAETGGLDLQGFIAGWCSLTTARDPSSSDITSICSATLTEKGIGRAASTIGHANTGGTATCPVRGS